LTRITRTESVIFWFLQLGIVAIPLVVTRGADTFRLPKELFFEALSAVVFSACAIQTLLHPAAGILKRLRGHRKGVAITLAAVLWTLITTLTSTQRILSIETLLWVTCCAMFSLSAVALLQPRQIHFLLIPFIPVTVNAIVAVLQRERIWNPWIFTPDIEIRYRTTGFLGNPDDVGALLVVPLIAAVVLTIEYRGRARLLFGTVAAVITAGLLATETLTSVMAAGIAASLLLVRLPRRITLAVIVAVALLIGGAFALHLPVTTRVAVVTKQLAGGEVLFATSSRLQSFSAAWRMFLDHPLVGVGPGCFGFWYVPYWVSSFYGHPEFMGFPDHFAEAHNDHLQTLATTGIVGYAIFCAALWLVASGRLTKGSDPRSPFVRTFALPAAVCMTIVTLGLFPLELAAPTSVMLYFAAAVVSWSALP
jgi:O-antigen ligase